MARSLREEHRFGGYIHLKTIPDAAPELLSAAGRWADRLSINVELPTEGGLKALAPEKNLRDIRQRHGAPAAGHRRGQGGEESARASRRPGRARR